MHTSDFLGTLQLFANKVNGLRASHGNLGGLPAVSQYGGTIPWASGSPQEETAAFYLMFSAGPQAVTYFLACPQDVSCGDFCSQALSGLCYLKQISFALQRQSAEQSIMCTLCLTKPTGQILPEEKIRL